MSEPIGFGPKTKKFLRALGRNNDKAWFDSHRREYEAYYLAPAKAFVEAVGPKLEKLSPNIVWEPRVNGSIFRVNRDIRFSKDKTPYKAYLHMLFQPRDADNAPKWFFGLEPDKLVLGAGIFGFEKGVIDRYRKRVAGPDGKALAKQLEKMRKAGIRIREPELKRVPSGFDADLPHAELLRHKGLTAWMDLPGGPAAAAKPTIVSASAAGFKTLKPLFAWLSALDDAHA